MPPEPCSDATSSMLSKLASKAELLPTGASGDDATRGQYSNLTRWRLRDLNCFRVHMRLSESNVEPACINHSRRCAMPSITQQVV
eukprot:5643394-Amphidinium_carterae.1